MVLPVELDVDASRTAQKMRMTLDEDPSYKKPVDTWSLQKKQNTENASEINVVHHWTIFDRKPYYFVSK